MTTQEFSDQFDVLISSYSGNSLLNFNEYEKSVFLTNAQEEIVINSYRGFTQNRESFEETEYKRRLLDKLISNYETDVIVESENNLEEHSIFFDIPDDLIAIINERIRLDSDCDNKLINVIPMKHDEYNMQKDNPFRKPLYNKRTKLAWRIDYGDIENQRVLEIVPPLGVKVEAYLARYIRKPKPILLTSFADNSINGYTDIQDSELHENYHRDILNLAIIKAIESKKFLGNNEN